MGIAYIRKYYGVPAKRGGRVLYKRPGMEKEGTIKGAKGAHLKIQLDGDTKPLLFHPTWNLTYL